MTTVVNVTIEVRWGKSKGQGEKDKGIERRERERGREREVSLRPLYLECSEDVN